MNDPFAHAAEIGAAKLDLPGLLRAVELEVDFEFAVLAVQGAQARREFVVARDDDPVGVEQRVLGRPCKIP